MSPESLDDWGYDAFPEGNQYSTPFSALLPV